ncbi:MAG: DapH/DapD/GlmU-related protein, partial [Lachnospiraceae bacterium]
MKKVLLILYMLIIHPILFWKYTIRADSRLFFTNGVIQSINTKGLKLGRNVRFGKNTRIDFYDTGFMRIGDGCYIGQNNTFLVGADISIGNGVLMASDICIASENHGMDPTDMNGYGAQRLITLPVFIGDGCWIGEKVIILPGTSIGSKSIIGAGSVVTKNVPDLCIAVGNPAKVIKKFDFEKEC